MSTVPDTAARAAGWVSAVRNQSFDGYDHRKILDLASDAAPGYFVAVRFLAGLENRLKLISTMLTSY
jgi:hypothetical protein